MESKELNEILNKTRRTPDISLTPKQVEELVKDLEDYEKLKKIMGTPIQDIMKRLKILELLKKCYYSASFSNTLFKTSYGFDNPQDIEKIGEWLDGKD